jgi:PhoH-like ATPase
MDRIYTSITEVKLTDAEWNKLYQKPRSRKKKEEVTYDNKSFPIPTSLKAFPTNHLFIIKGGEDTNFRFLVRKTEDRLLIIQEEDLKLKEITPRNNEQSFALSALLDPSINLIALTGKAGTGKTLVALAAALHQKKFYKEILVARPAMEMSDKTLGFLPGNKDEKIDPYMMPIYDNLAVIKEKLEPDKNLDVQEPIREWAKANQIEVLVLNYVRGRSLSERFIIIDEAQNLTPHEIKTIVTRAGEGTKIVVIGDITQIDSPYQNERSNGLSYLIDKWKGEPEFVHVHMIHGERSHLADKAGRIM